MEPKSEIIETVTKYLIFVRFALQWHSELNATFILLFVQEVQRKKQYS